MTQRAILAPTMQQSIEILLLPIIDLQTVIEQQLQENPLLEIDERRTREEKDAFYEELQNRIQHYDSVRTPRGFYSPDDEKYEARPLEAKLPLEDHLLKQLRLEISDRDEIRIGEFIIYNLNDKGYLQISCEEIAQIFNLESAAPVDSVLRIIQNFDPIGIASRNLKECLLLQINSRFQENSQIVKKLINRHMDELGKKKYASIAKSMNISVELVKTIAQKISQLEPMPARNFRPVENNIYIKPDVKIFKDENDSYQVSSNSSYLPHLRINHYYQKMLSRPNCSPEEKHFIQEKMKNAFIFMKSIDQRKSTLEKIGHYIIQNQLEFLEYGLRNLKPMRLKDVASKLERNESTISRAISNKFVDTPQGLFSLKYFFTQGIDNKNGNAISSRTVKEEIKDLIKDENQNKPLSDQDIYHYLAEKGLGVSRRTVAKYRQAMKILPSHLRKH